VIVPSERDQRPRHASEEQRPPRADDVVAVRFGASFRNGGWLDDDVRGLPERAASSACNHCSVVRPRAFCGACTRQELTTIPEPWARRCGDRPSRCR
jgi:hypothetical protein